MRIILFMIGALIASLSIALAVETSGEVISSPLNSTTAPAEPAATENYQSAFYQQYLINQRGFEAILKDSILSKDFTGTYQIFDCRTQVEKEIEQKLASTILSFNYADTPLHEVVTNLGEQLSVNVYIDEKSLSEEGIPTDEPISLSFTHPIRAEAGLNMILKKLGLTCYAANDVLTISTKTTADEYAIVCMYDVRGLGFDTQLEMITLVNIITTKAGDEFAWDIVGGVGTIENIPGAVIVRQTPKVHNEIKALLDQFQKFVTPMKP
ncbi:hypothetical protein [Lacunimicrobium album]